MFDSRKWALLAVILGLMGLVACAKNKKGAEAPKVATGPPKVNCDDAKLYEYNSDTRKWVRKDNQEVVNCNPDSGVLPVDKQKGCSIYDGYYRVSFDNTTSTHTNSTTNIYCVHISYFPSAYHSYLNPYTTYRGGSCTAGVNCSYYNNNGYYHNGYYNHWHPTHGGFYLGIGFGIGLGF